MIDYEERREVYARAIGTYGAGTQIVVALEELSEAQKELCKYMRGDGDMEHLAEEIADAAIMLEQMCMLWCLRKRVGEYIDAKVQRLADRLQAADK